jgi:hypothetical protein
MALDTNIALNASAPAPINPLQQALQVAQFRAYNANGLAAQQGLNANRAISAAYQQATDPTTGKVDNNKLMALISQNPDAGFKLGEVVQGINTQKQQQQTLDRGDIALNNDQRENYASGTKFLTQQMAAVDPNDPNAAKKIIDIGTAAVQQGHIPAAMFKSVVAQFPDDAKEWPQFIQKRLASFQDPGAQLGSITPKPTLVNNGASQQYIDTNAISNPGIVGTTIQNQLSPESATSPVGVMGPNNTPGVVPRGEMWNAPPLPSSGPTTPNGPDRTYLPNQAPAPAGQAGGPAHFVATGTPMGVADSNQGNVDVVNKHWTSVGNDANNAQTNIGLAQNIKAYAHQAATGKQGDKLAAANGLLSVFGVGGQTDLNTATDLLQKNMARLSLTSRQGAGGTDAAGALATAANPHGSMTMAAIEDAADQVIGSQKMALAQQQLLQPYKLKNDVAGYQSTLSKFNQAADPRVWQFQGMTPEQRASFKAGMSPADQKAFSSKIRTLEGMGAIQ